jgi:hypothetical protein
MMTVRRFIVGGFTSGLALVIFLLPAGTPARGRAQSSAAATAQKGTEMTKHATGTFDVKVIPEGTDDKAEGSTLGRMSIDKQYHGELDGTSIGQMLTAGTDVKGSAGYVAMERFTGTLNGRKGSFVLQHTGTMNRSALQLSITVVPDSGTDQLAGITGKLAIIIADGKHSYDFEYALPDTTHTP